MVYGRSELVRYDVVWLRKWRGRLGIAADDVTGSLAALRPVPRSSAATVAWAERLRLG